MPLQPTISAQRRQLAHRAAIQARRVASRDLNENAISASSALVRSRHIAESRGTVSWWGRRTTSAGVGLKDRRRTGGSASSGAANDSQIRSGSNLRYSVAPISVASPHAGAARLGHHPSTALLSSIIKPLTHDTPPLIALDIPPFHRRREPKTITRTLFSCSAACLSRAAMNCLRCFGVVVSTHAATRIPSAIQNSSGLGMWLPFRVISSCSIQAHWPVPLANAPHTHNRSLALRHSVPCAFGGP